MLNADILITLWVSLFHTRTNFLVQYGKGSSAYCRSLKNSADVVVLLYIFPVLSKAGNFEK